MQSLVAIALVGAALLSGVAYADVGKTLDAQMELRYVEPLAVLHVKATGYNAADGHEWCGRLGCGKVVYTGGAPWVGTVAVSEPLSHRLPMGTLVRIHGWLYRVRDLMGPTVREDQVDIYFSSVDEALNWGVRGVDVEVLGPEEDDL